MNEYLNRNDENDAVSTEDFPWLTFSLCGSHYAVNSRIVTSILLLEQQINPIPESPEYIKGIINLRGEIVPLLDLRVLFKMKSFDDEFEEFTQMLAARKQDHINWVAALRKSVENKTEFTLTTDPEKCALGRWLASYETEYASVKFCLKELVEPHEKIHALADEIEHILSNPNGQEEAELLLQN
ncbi:MAG: chemotaxis protein CheW, partial [Oscillospiraceae bacterium]